MVLENAMQCLGCREMAVGECEEGGERAGEDKACFCEVKRR